jgi:Protein kinase domain
MIFESSGVICRRCGAPLMRAGPLGGHCLTCLLEMALEDENELADGTEFFDQYRLITQDDGTPVELGRGAMGVTYKAVDIDLRCEVTLKVIRGKDLGEESARLRFLREARAAASVRHPNVASVFHLGRTDENYFYAMEFVEGETLESLLRRSGKFEVRTALEITRQVAAGLAAVHKQKLVHRDIKPSNIMVNFEEEGAVSAEDHRSGPCQGSQPTHCPDNHFNDRTLCWDPGVRQPRAIWGSWSRHPLRSLFGRSAALGDANR